MRDDQFYMPARVYGGDDIVRRHAADLKKFGKKALIVTGRHSAVKCGVYDDICAALDSVGTEHCWFNEVEENPSVGTIMKARDFGIAEGADFVIGAGGGSPMDAAKAIALMIRHADRGAEYLYTAGADSSVIPVVCIPTTCGTGSEVTAVSVLTNEQMQTKKSIPHKIFPDLSLIDGKYLMGADRKILCCTGFDALAHLYESWLNSAAVPMSRLIAEAGMREWKESLPVLKGEREMNTDDAERMMRAAMLGGMAIAHTGTSIPHGLSYALTYHLRVPHGKAVCFFMPGYLKAADPGDAAYILQLAGFRDADDFGSVYQAACGPLDVDSDALAAVLERAVDELSSDPAKCAKAPFAVSREVLRKIVFN